MTQVHIPTRLRRGSSRKEKDNFEVQLKRFAEEILEVNLRVDSKWSGRGWCYILEPYGLSKGDFDYAEDLILRCRKNGMLPVDFTAEDDKRTTEDPESVHDEAPEEYAESWLDTALLCWQWYTPVSFWDFQKVYLEMWVEKIDLKTLFRPVCDEYKVRIANCGGSTDVNMRVRIMRRFQKQEKAGRRCWILYCGDHDPSGIRMVQDLFNNCKDLTDAVGFSMDDVMLYHFGLTAEFIDEHGLTWIDGLKTGSGKDLADPSHPDHYKDYVQDYLKKYGARKCEANALLVVPDVGRRLCRDAILKRLGPEGSKGIERYKKAVAEARRRCREVIPDVVDRLLRGDGA
jgi:hypothetical protein